MEIEATPDQVRRYSKIASEVTLLFYDNGVTRNEGMDVLALVVVSMMVGLGIQQDEAHTMADDLAECIKTNFDLRQRNYEPLN
jgi:hypothetical protein